MVPPGKDSIACESARRCPRADRPQARECFETELGSQPERDQNSETVVCVKTLTRTIGQPSVSSLDNADTQFCSSKRVSCETAEQLSHSCNCCWSARKSTGFETMLLQPLSRICCRSAIIACAVTAITGTSDNRGCSRIQDARDNPSSAPSWISNSTIFGCWFLSAANAAFRSAATETS